MKYVGLSLLGLILLLSLCWISVGNEFFLYKFFTPKIVQVQREVFENSRSFNQGMVQELENMRFEYEKEKDLNAKVALKSIILHRASGYNLNNPIVPYDLRVFINNLKSQ